MTASRCVDVPAVVCELRARVSAIADDKYERRRVAQDSHLVKGPDAASTVSFGAKNIYNQPLIKC